MIDFYRFGMDKTISSVLNQNLFLMNKKPHLLKENIHSQIMI